MNKHIVRMALAGVLTAMLLAGCTRTAPQTTYYSLHVPAQRAAQAPTLADSTLALSIGPVVIPDILKQAQIATGGDDGRYRLAEYHRWSGELDRDLARAVAEQLAGNLGTERVAIFPWDQNITSNCRVLIDVLNMGGETGKEATLSVRWTLLDPQGKKPPVIRRSELREVPAAAGYAAWVAAQQRNVVKLGQEIAIEVKTFAIP